MMKQHLKIIKKCIKECRPWYLIWLFLIVLCGTITYFEYLFVEYGVNIAENLYNNVIHDIKFISYVKPLIFLMFLFILKNLIVVFMQAKRVKISNKLIKLHNCNLIKKISKLEYEFFERQDILSKISLVKNESENAFENLNNYIIEWIIISIMQILSYLIYLSRIKIWIPVLFILLAILYVYIGLVCGKKIHKNYYDTEVIRSHRNYLYNCSKNKSAHQDSLVNRLYGYITSKWEKKNNEWCDQKIKYHIRKDFYILLPDILYCFIVIIIMFIAINNIDRLTIGYVTSLLGITISLGVSLKSFSNKIALYSKDIKIYKDYEELMCLSEEREYIKNDLPDGYKIEIKNLCYIYPQSNNKALNDLNLEICNNETIAIVGMNGSGKSTFVNIFIELLSNYNGNILINKKNLKNNVGLLRNNCSAILQDFNQYPFTIKENILLGDINREISDEEIWDVLEKVNLKEYIQSLPNGINTMLGEVEWGMDLSKGQWQRLAIARLLINKDAKIWILDEPTAHLDPLAEIELYNLIYEFRENRTLIFISHRLGFAKKANRIIVFKEGKVIEDSNHDELLKDKCSEYYKMYEKQKKWYE